MSDLVREVLEDAKALIDTPDKWVKGAYHGDDGTTHCALGALTIAVFRHREVYPIHSIAHKVLRAEVPPVYLTISAFNDSSKTTHADVMDMFDRAIKRVVDGNVCAE